MTGNYLLDVFVVAGIIAAGLGLLFVLGRIGRRLWRIFQGVDDFLDDWRGQPARPGHPPQPGVMERLEVIEHEVQTNDGSSLKDAVRRVEEKLTTHLENLED
ncbi:hypothetical protein [Nonomuraea typhae]|uniref:hypothetical protein n=1 Tax=Nonomuraea typhae TaxID=2603600 RepID=UPI0012F76EB0|nr:hypothetical protein [Nonomuraea typhae]